MRRRWSLLGPVPAELLQDANACRRLIAVGPANKFPTGDNFTCTASSLHPGGANFAMCDGSVRFIKDTVNSWNPFLIQFNGRNAAYTGVNGVLPNGVYQALHTRSGGEVISADAF